MVPSPVLDCFITNYYYEVRTLHRNVQCRNYAQTPDREQLTRFEVPVFRDVDTPTHPLSPHKDKGCRHSAYLIGLWYSSYTRRKKTMFLAEGPFHLCLTATQGVNCMPLPDVLLASRESCQQKQPWQAIP